MRSYINLRIDGKNETISGNEVFLNLADYLRQISFLKGTKVVCSEGDCGACTVLLKTTFATHFKAANSCILPLFTLDHCEILTIDGLKHNQDQLYTQITEQLFKQLGTQCGFCTPGFIMQMRAMGEKKAVTNSAPDSAQIVSCLSGNLCRCTGYQAILNVAEQLLTNDTAPVKKINCTPQDAKNNLNQNQNQNQDEIQDKKTYKKPDKKQNIIKNLKHNQNLTIKNALIKTDEHEVFIPASLADALKYKQENPQALIVAGATDLAVKWNKGIAKPAQFLDLHLLNELYEFTETETNYHIGSHLSLNDMTTKIDQSEINKLMDRFASEQIRNVGTLAGNIVNASPIGDTLPLLYVLKAEINLQSSQGKRALPLQKFILDYRKTALLSNEIVTHINLPKLKENYFLQLEKISRRHFLDIANVTFAGLVSIKNNTIEHLQLAYGGVGPTVLELEQLAQSMLGAKWERKLFEDLALKIPTEIKARTDLRASAKYREKIAQNLFLNFFDTIEKKRISLSHPTPVNGTEAPL